MRHEASYLRDALLALDELRDFLGTSNRDAFLESRLEQGFVFQRLVILGEACVHLAKLFQRKYPLVPWPSLIALRNRLVHAYFDLDQELLWDMVNDGLVPLRVQFAESRDAEFPDPPEGLLAHQRDGIASGQIARPAHETAGGFADACVNRPSRVERLAPETPRRLPHRSNSPSAIGATAPLPPAESQPHEICYP